MCVYIYIYTHTYIHIYTCIILYHIAYHMLLYHIIIYHYHSCQHILCMYIKRNKYIYIYIHTYVCIYIYMYIYIYTHMHVFRTVSTHDARIQEQFEVRNSLATGVDWSSRIRFSLHHGFGAQQPSYWVLKQATQRYWVMLMLLSSRSHYTDGSNTCVLHLELLSILSFISHACLTWPQLPCSRWFVPGIYNASSMPPYPSRSHHMFLFLYVSAVCRWPSR